MRLDLTDPDAARRVADWVRHAREQRGWTQDRLIERAGHGLSGSTLTTIESGQPGRRNRSIIDAIERGLNVPLGTIERVADGVDVDPDDAQLNDTDGQTLEQLRRLLEMVREDRADLAALREEVAELRAARGGEGPSRAG